MKFEKWLDTLVAEKDLDLDHTFEYNGPVYGMNMIPLEAVVEQIKAFQSQPIYSLSSLVFDTRLRDLQFWNVVQTKSLFLLLPTSV